LANSNIAEFQGHCLLDLSLSVWWRVKWLRNHAVLYARRPLLTVCVP
jgi:hypothetical protein